MEIKHFEGKKKVINWMPNFIAILRLLYLKKKKLEDEM